MRLLAITLALLLGLVAGCSARADEDAASAPTTPVAAESPSPTAAPTPAPAPKATPEPRPKKKPDPVSMQALIEKRYDGRDLKRGRLMRDQGSYKRYAISYRGDGK